MNDKALMRNTHPVPTAAIMNPAMAGPIMRAALNEVEFRPTAFARSSSPTSSATKVCRAVESNALTHPKRNANRYTCHNRTRPESVKMLKPSASKPRMAWVDDHELAAIEPVGHESRKWQHQGERPELQRHDDAERGGTLVRKFREHQPVLRCALHPGAHVRHQSPRGPHAIVVIAKRAESRQHAIRTAS